MSVSPSEPSSGYHRVVRSPLRIDHAVVCLALAGLHCGSRTGLTDAVFSDAGVRELHDARAQADVSLLGDARQPADSTADGAPVDASSCTPAPAGGVTVGSFPENVISMAIAVLGSTIYAGTTAIGGDASPLYNAAFSRVPAVGGATLSVNAPDYNFGPLVTDGARVYYEQTSGAPTGPNGAIYQTLGLAAIDLASGTVEPIATTAVPYSTSSVLGSDMLAATSASPGVYWAGASGGSDSATGVFQWDPETGTVTMIATGQAIRGLAVDASGVYWADTGGAQGDGITLWKGPLGGGPSTMLATVPGGTFGQLLGVSSDDVVFVSDYMSGAIDTVSKQGGAVTPLAKSAGAWVNASAWVDSHYLYWTEDSSPTKLTRVPVAGGSPDVVPTEGAIQSLAFDACNLYIGTYGPTQVLILPNPG